MSHPLAMLQGEELMTYAIDDAERSSACEILYACRSKIASDIQQEASRDRPDARRLADLSALDPHCLYCSKEW